MDRSEGDFLSDLLSVDGSCGNHVSVMDATLSEEEHDEEEVEDADVK